MYVRWCNIKRGQKECIEEYTARYVQYQSELEDTTKAITTIELVRKLRQGLGTHMNQINSTINDLCVDLPQWSDTLPMYHLMDQAIQYFAKLSNSTTNNIQYDFIEHNIQHNYNKSNNNTNNNNNNNNNRVHDKNNINNGHVKRNNLPQGFSNLENWKSYIKKVVGTHSFIND